MQRVIDIARLREHPRVVEATAKIAALGGLAIVIGGDIHVAIDHQPSS